MCSVTMALAGLTTGLQMAGQYRESRAQAAALNAQADAAYQNAKIQNRKSEQLAERYAQEQRELDNKRRLVAGQQAAAAGASGIAGGVGSALDVYTATNEAWKQDSLNLLSNQRSDTHDSYIQEVNYTNQGNSYRSQAKAAKQAGNWAMVGTLLSGAASMYGMKTGGASSSGTGAVYSGTNTGASFITGQPAISALNAGRSGFYMDPLMKKSMYGV